MELQITFEDVESLEKFQGQFTDLHISLVQKRPGSGDQGLHDVTIKIEGDPDRVAEFVEKTGLKNRN